MICGKRQIQNRIFGEIYRLQIGEECVKLQSTNILVYQTQRKKEHETC